MKQLTAKFVEKVRRPGTYRDAHGLRFRVRRSGRRYWEQRVATNTGRRTLGIGPYPVVSLNEARALARHNVARLEAGDHQNLHRGQPQSPSFEEAARTVRDLNTPVWTNPRTPESWYRSLELYAFPHIGSRPVGDIDTADLMSVLKPIWSSRQSLAQDVRQRIGTVMEWAIGRKYRHDNPAKDVGAALPRASSGERRHHRALPYADVSTAIATVWSSTARLTTQLAFEFLVLTTARSCVPVRLCGEVPGCRRGLPLRKGCVNARFGKPRCRTSTDEFRDRKNRMMVPTVQMTTVVFAGGPFPNTMFNEREFFGGRLDADKQFRVGPAAAFRYESGAYTFELVPDRIDLKALGDDLFPEPLLESADIVAQQLKAVGPAVPVTATGLNCDAVLPRSAVGVDGKAFCAALADPALQQLADAPLSHTCARMGFASGRFTYDVRIEPYHESRGEDLFVAVNATRRDGSSALDGRRDDVDEFKQYLVVFRERLAVLGASRS